MTGIDDDLMPRWRRLDLTLRQDVTLGQGPRANNRQQTTLHVPGSALRGALAAVWLREDGGRSPEFLDVFEGDGVFGPAHGDASRPISLAVRRHKYAADCGRTDWDEAYGETAEECPTCGTALEPAKGGPTGRVPQRSRMRVAIGPNGLAEEGRLFERAVLKRGTAFSAWLLGSAVRAVERPEGMVRQIRLGGELSIRGLVDIALHDADPEPVEVWNGDVILRLASPGVFVDAFGMATDRPNDDELSELLGVEAKITQAWTRWTSVGGWHGASGLPKPQEQVVAAGSTYLVSCSEKPSRRRRRLAVLRGIGLRRREGFGALLPYPQRRSQVEAKRGMRFTVLTTLPPWNNGKLKERLHVLGQDRYWPPTGEAVAEIMEWLREQLRSSSATQLRIGHFNTEFSALAELLSEPDLDAYLDLLEHLEK